jgi:hypothetical protein
MNKKYGSPNSGPGSVVFPEATPVMLIESTPNTVGHTGIKLAILPLDHVYVVRIAIHKSNYI